MDEQDAVARVEQENARPEAQFCWLDGIGHGRLVSGCGPGFEDVQVAEHTVGTVTALPASAAQQAASHLRFRAVFSALARPRRTGGQPGRAAPPPRRRAPKAAAALRPGAVPLRRADIILPARGRGTIILTAACPRTGAAWTSAGTSFEPRSLKHRPDGAICAFPIPPSRPACSASTRPNPGPQRTGGCSAAPSAACSASRPTAGPGTPPAGPRPARTWPVAVGCQNLDYGL